MGKALYGASDFNVHQFMIGFLVQVILFNGVLWKVSEFHPHLLITLERVAKVEMLMSKHMYFASLVLRTLFCRIF